MYLQSLLLVLLLTPTPPSQASTWGSPSTSTPSTTLHNPLKASLLKKIDVDIADLEQLVEDHNARTSIGESDEEGMERRLIVLPLDDKFDVPKGMFSHGHVQTGDKMCLPKNYFNLIRRRMPEIPWLFEVSRVDDDDDDVPTSPRVKLPPPLEDRGLTKVVGGALDFRAPANFIFLPKWMFVALALKPKDVVRVRLKEDTPAGSMVKLRPHTSDFLEISNHQAVLETELRHYSSLVRGTAIPFDYNGKRYRFDVVDLRSAPDGTRVTMAKVQDCDIAVDFLKPKDYKKKKK